MLQDFNWINKFESDLKGLYHETFYSSIAGKKIGYGVYIPSSFAENIKQYPVLYWLHGKGGNESDGPHLKIPHLIDVLISKKAIKPFIIVFVNGFSYSMYCDSYDHEIPAESYIIHDLLPYIDNKYNTFAEKRAIDGFSMGGFGALKMAFKFPAMFKSVITYGGSFHDLESVSRNRPDVFKKIFAEKLDYFQKNSSFEIAKKNSGLIKKFLRIRTIVGSTDFTLQNNHKIWILLRNLHIDFEKVLLEGYGHSCQPYYEKEGANGFRFHFQ